MGRFNTRQFAALAFGQLKMYTALYSASRCSRYGFSEFRRLVALRGSNPSAGTRTVRGMSGSPSTGADDFERLRDVVAELRQPQ
jgi:hypothetical protein